MSQSDSTVRHLYVELARLDLLIHRRLSAMERALADDALGDAVPSATQASEPDPAPEPARDAAPDAAQTVAAEPTAGGVLRDLTATVGAHTPARTQASGSLFLNFGEAYRMLQQPFGERRGADSQEDAQIHGDSDGAYAQALANLEAQIATLVAAAEESGDPSRLVHLAATCELTRFELDAILICLAPALDLRYERLYGFMHDDLTRRRATVSLILDLLAPPGPARLAALSRFGDGLTLFRDRLVERVAEPGILSPVLLNTALAPEPSLVTWLLGDYRPGPALRDWVTWEPEPQPHEDRFLQAQMEELARSAEDDGLLAMVGKDGAARRAAMETFCDLVEAPLLLLDIGEARQAGADLEALLHLFLRDARLNRAVAAIAGWEAVLDEGAPPFALFDMLCAHSGPVLIGSDEPWLPRSPHRDRRVRWINFPAPEFVQRRDYLGHLVNGLENGDALDVEGLAGRFVLTTGQMNDLVASALDRATQQGRSLISDDLFAAAREHSSPRLSSLARKLTPRYAFEDLILPEDQIARLRELVLMVEGRAQVLDEWGLGRKLAPSYGITALFAGGPGTGKTMAAEVIARQLGLDVYKIDLSGLVSKYIGETEKNLEKVFSEAESSNAILFFDEADAIFGKRSEVKDAHDRYANIETSYLLQRMEAYDGVTILATNLRANLDEAFTRRLHAVVDFPFPDAEQRLRIWKALFPASVPASGTVDLETLARRYKIAGGSIRNVLVSASYFASAAHEPLGMAHLLHATRRELQKLGRLTDERDFVAQG